MRSITIRAEDALIDALDARAEAEGESRNAVAVEALRLHLQAETPDSACTAGAGAAIADDCKTADSECGESAALVDLLTTQLAEKDRQIQALEAALRESMSATSEALRTAQAAQAIQAASRPGLVERIRGFFAKDISPQ